MSSGSNVAANRPRRNRSPVCPYTRCLITSLPACRALDPIISSCDSLSPLQGQAQLMRTVKTEVRRKRVRALVRRKAQRMRATEISAFMRGKQRAPSDRG